MKKYLLIIALIAAFGFAPLTQKAQAWGGVRIGIGVPLYVAPGPYYYGYPYYYPPAYVAPAPAVVYQTAPPPVVVRTPGEAVPAPAPTPALVPFPAPAPAPLPPLIPTSTQPQASALLSQLNDANASVRRDAAVELGRMKAVSQVDALMSMLAKDASPIAREGAARALGLIAAPRSLTALIYAAQADNDREVRHSAQFAAEVIRSNLRGN